MITTALAKHLGTRKKIRNVARVFKGRLPANYRAPVGVVVTRAGGRPMYYLSGESTLAQARLQVNVTARGEAERLEASELMRDINDAISGFRGTWDDTTVHGCTAEHAPIEVSAPGSGEWDYEIAVTYLVHYEQAGVTFSVVDRDLGPILAEDGPDLFTEDGIPIFQEELPT